MKKAFALFLALVLPLSLLSCDMESQNAAFEASDVQNSAESDISSDDSEIQIPPLVDYVDVFRQTEAYDGQYISVAGRITNFNNDYSFYFNERLGLDDDGLGFRISLDHTRAIRELYSIGDYVVVEGVWHNGYFSELQKARIILDGTAAYDTASEMGQGKRSVRPRNTDCQLHANCRKH